MQYLDIISIYTLYGEILFKYCKNCNGFIACMNMLDMLDMFNTSSLYGCDFCTELYIGFYTFVLYVSYISTCFMFKQSRFGQHGHCLQETGGKYMGQSEWCLYEGNIPLHL